MAGRRKRGGVEVPGTVKLVVSVFDLGILFCSSANVFVTQKRDPP